MIDTVTDQQQNAITTLEALSNPHRGIVVEAWGMDEAAVDLCTNDTEHGAGICYLPDLDGGCLECAVTHLRENLVDGRMVSVDVAR